MAVEFKAAVDTATVGTPGAVLLTLANGFGVAGCAVATNGLLGLRFRKIAAAISNKNAATPTLFFI
jgi:hypothetical protein